MATLQREGSEKGHCREKRNEAAPVKSGGHAAERA
jgi:hypothetical protein